MLWNSTEQVLPAILQRVAKVEGVKFKKTPLSKHEYEEDRIKPVSVRLMESIVSKRLVLVAVSGYCQGSAHAAELPVASGLPKSRTFTHEGGVYEVQCEHRAWLLHDLVEPSPVVPLQVASQLPISCQ